MSNISPLCQLNNGCMGCCGHDFLSKVKVKEAIRNNTKEFEIKNPQTRADFGEFRDREHKSNLRNGVCRNLVELKGCYLCPLHPARHEEKDLRIGHCDVDHLCKTAKQFSWWDEDKKKKFINFIENKKLSNIDYSMMMDRDELLTEFELI